MLSALAQEHRLAIYRHLVRAGENGMRVGEIGERLELSGATLSFHLKTLKQAGLIECKRQGRLLIYRANYPIMNQLLGYLTENCCGGEPCALVENDLTEKITSA